MDREDNLEIHFSGPGEQEIYLVDKGHEGEDVGML
jgi:hypothetical protein